MHNPNEFHVRIMALVAVCFISFLVVSSRNDSSILDYLLLSLVSFVIGVELFKKK